MYRINKTKQKLLVSGSLLTICILWLALYLQIAHDRDQARLAAEVNAANLARTFEEHIISTVQQIDALLLQLREEYALSPATFGARLRFHQQQAFNGLIIQVTVTDAAGMMVYSDKPLPKTPLDLSDREHVRIHRSTGKDLLFISKPVLGRVSKKWSIQFTRKILGRNGAPAGVMIISIDPEYFSEFFRSVDVGKHGVITLLGMDRVIRVRSIGTDKGGDAKGVTIPPGQPLFDPAKPEVGCYSIPSLVDGITRIAAYRRLRQYPLVVRVAFAEADVYRPVNLRARNLLVAGTLLSAALLGGLFWILALEKRQAGLHEKIVENEEKFRTLADFTSDWEYWIDPSRRFVYSSLSCLAITGYAPEEFLQDPDLLRKITHPEDRPLFVSHLDAIGPTGASHAAKVDLEFRIVTKKGEIRWLSHLCSPVSGKDGTDKGRRASNRDITERKLLACKMEEDHALLQTLMDTIPDMIFYKDRNCVFRGCNEALASRLLDRPKERIVGRTLYEFEATAHAAGLLHLQDRETMDSGETARYDELIRLADGREFCVETIKAPLRDRLGNVTGVMGISRDISERKQAEEALQQSKELLRTITDRVPGALFLFRRRPEGGISFPWFNSGMVELTGIDEVSLKADAGLVRDFIHPDDAQRVHDALIESLQAENAFRAEWRQRQPASAEYRWIRCDSVSRRDGSGSAVWYGYLADIHDMKTIEEHLRNALAEVEQLAATDPLTRLANRRSFFDSAKSEFSRSQRHDRPLAVLMMDIDYFKRINDSLGHAAGDAVLQGCAAVIRGCVRDSDIIARYGGEEFVVLLPETDAAGALAIAQRIRGDVAAAEFPGRQDGGGIRITASLGVALRSPGSEIPVFDLLLQQADKALYEAKHRGRNQVVRYLAS